MRIVPGQKIAYITDAEWHKNNRNAMIELANQAELLYIEVTFMRCDAEHGLRKSHLTARQAGEVARAAGAGCVIPMHFSSRLEPATGRCYARKSRKLSAGRCSDRIVYDPCRADIGS